MTNILVRDAKPTDDHILANFNLQLAFESESITLEPVVVLSGVRKVLADPAKGKYFVAVVGDPLVGEEVVGGEVVGCTMITHEWSDWRDADIWWFQSVYVRQDLRQRGVFRALHSHVVQAAKRAGACALRLYVEEHNTAAIATYSRLGMSAGHYRIMEQPLTPGALPT